MSLKYLLQLRCVQVTHLGWLQCFVLAFSVVSVGSLPAVVCSEVVRLLSVVQRSMNWSSVGVSLAVI